MIAEMVGVVDDGGNGSLKVAKVENDPLAGSVSIAVLSKAGV